MIKPVGLDHIVLRTADLERSQAFYCDVLGCEVVRRSPPLGLIQLQAGAHLIDLMDVNGSLGEVGGPAPKPLDGINMDHFCLIVKDWDEKTIKAELAARGVDIFIDTGRRFGANGYGNSLYIQDPDGNVIELKAA